MSTIPDNYIATISPEESAVYRLEIQLAKQTQKLDDYIAAQDARRNHDEAQRCIQQKKQRRNEWLIALASAGITQILNLIFN